MVLLEVFERTECGDSMIALNMSRSLDAKKIQMHNPPANVRMSQWQGAGDQG